MVLLILVFRQLQSKQCIKATRFFFWIVMLCPCCYADLWKHGGFNIYKYDETRNTYRATCLSLVSQALPRGHPTIHIRSLYVTQSKYAFQSYDILCNNSFCISFVVWYILGIVSAQICIHLFKVNSKYQQHRK